MVSFIDKLLILESTERDANARIAHFALTIGIRDALAEHVG